MAKRYPRNYGGVKSAYYIKHIIYESDEYSGAIVFSIMMVLSIFASMYALLLWLLYFHYPILLDIPNCMSGNHCYGEGVS